MTDITYIMPSVDVDTETQNAIYSKLRPFKQFYAYTTVIESTVFHKKIFGTPAIAYDLKEWNAGVGIRPLTPDTYHLVKRSNLCDGYLWDAEKNAMEQKDYDAIDKEFVCDPSRFKRVVLYGMHTYGGYYGFFRPDLKEVIQLLVQADVNVLAYNHVYVTTEMWPSEDAKSCYDVTADRHRAKTTVYFPVLKESAGAENKEAVVSNNRKVADLDCLVVNTIGEKSEVITDWEDQKVFLSKELTRIIEDLPFDLDQSYAERTLNALHLELWQTVNGTVSPFTQSSYCNETETNKVNRLKSLIKELNSKNSVDKGWGKLLSLNTFGCNRFNEGHIKFGIIRQKKKADVVSTEIKTDSVMADNVDSNESKTDSVMVDDASDKVVQPDGTWRQDVILIMTANNKITRIKRKRCDEPACVVTNRIGGVSNVILDLSEQKALLTQQIQHQVDHGVDDDIENLHARLWHAVDSKLPMCITDENPRDRKIRKTKQCKDMLVDLNEKDSFDNGWRKMFELGTFELDVFSYGFVNLGIIGPHK